MRKYDIVVTQREVTWFIDTQAITHIRVMRASNEVRIHQLIPGATMQ